MRLLVANRGEIARRIFLSAHAVGWETVAAYADPDAEAPFVSEATHAVRLGPAELAASYLSVDALLDAARQSGATAVHPGYGFLSESPQLAQAVVAAGLTWVGPNPTAIEQMGSKKQARLLAEAAGVPVVPGHAPSTTGTEGTAELRQAAERLGYPVLLKASAGGGGRGIRIVREPADFDQALADAQQESLRAFGDDTMLVERFIERPRHVEVQLLGDLHGGITHLGTRECSVQRRFQKLIEEAPATGLSADTTDGLCGAAVALGRSIGYDNAGTVEFVVDADTDEFFFLEVNTRLQVEHTVTEQVTGVDLVAAQLEVASGATLAELGLGEDAELDMEAHSIQVRLYTEDPSAGFAPRTGPVDWVEVPAGVRFDSAVEPGSTVTSNYDPMVGKLVVTAADRSVAVADLATALDEVVLGPVETNVGFLRWIVDQPDYQAGAVTTRWVDDVVSALDEMPFAAPAEGSAAELQAAEAAAEACWVARNERRAADNGPWGSLRGWRLVDERAPARLLLRRHGCETVTEVCDNRTRGAAPLTAVADVANSTAAANVAGHTLCFSVLSRSEAWADREPVGAHGASSLVAPFTAVVVEVAVAPGDRVVAGDRLVVLEAMKMLHTLTATASAEVQMVAVSAGDTVETDAVLVQFSSDEPTTETP